MGRRKGEGRGEMWPGWKGATQAPDWASDTRVSRTDRPQPGWQGQDAGFMSPSLRQRWGRDLGGWELCARPGPPGSLGGRSVSRRGMWVP